MKTYCSIEPETWVIALRGLMGYPLTSPARHTRCRSRSAGPFGTDWRKSPIIATSRGSSISSMLRVEIGADWHRPTASSWRSAATIR